MEYDSVVRDFARRSRQNLAFVLEAARRNAADSSVQQVFEVAQLVNSMLGLLVFPRERCFDSIHSRTLDELNADGWPRILPTRGFPEAPDRHELLRYLRNAIAHFNIEFLAASGRFEGIRVWNCKQGVKN